jgi:hypothetical protein
MSEVFVVFPPLTSNSIIYGRNSFSFCCKEILYSKEATTQVSFQLEEVFTLVSYKFFNYEFFQCQTIEVEAEANPFGYILNGTCGANEKNVSISTLFAENKPEKGLSAFDLVK